MVVVLGSAAIFLNLLDYACKEQIQKQIRKSEKGGFWQALVTFCDQETHF